MARFFLGLLTSGSSLVISFTTGIGLSLVVYIQRIPNSR